MSIETGISLLGIVLIEKIRLALVETQRVSASNDLLREYNDWRDTLDFESLSELEAKQLEHERLAVLELIKQGRNPDAIIKRRLRKVRRQSQ